MKAINRLLSIIGGISLFLGVFWLFTLSPAWPFSSEVGYEELDRIASADKAYEIVPIRGNSGATNRYSYQIFVVPFGEKVEPEQSWVHQVFRSAARTHLLGYDWNGNDVVIKIQDGPIGYYMSYYGEGDEYGVKKTGNVLLQIQRK